jgi:3-hydroxyacyl-CoA dehydrogenase/enoyl-CoA hydratase/3-hydroxybutyryl-CoA epimerase
MSAFHVTFEQGIALLVFDLPGEPVNKLSPAAVADFERLFFGQLAQDPLIQAVVLLSGKPDNFIAGADIDQLQLIADAEAGTAMSQAGQDLINRVEAYPKPVVAAVDGKDRGVGRRPQQDAKRQRQDRDLLDAPESDGGGRRVNAHRL